jgi:hypothetical protein
VKLLLCVKDLTCERIKTHQSWYSSVTLNAQRVALGTWGDTANTDLYHNHCTGGADRVELYVHRNSDYSRDVKCRAWRTGSRAPPSHAKTQVRSQARPRKTSGSVTGFSPSTSVFPCECRSTIAAYSLIHSFTACIRIVTATGTVVKHTYKCKKIRKFLTNCATVSISWRSCHWQLGVWSC